MFSQGNAENVFALGNNPQITFQERVSQICKSALLEVQMFALSGPCPCIASLTSRVSESDLFSNGLFSFRKGKFLCILV